MRTTAAQTCPHQHQQEHRQSITERQRNEQRCQQRRIIGLTRHQETENRSSAGGQRHAPDKGKQSRERRELIHAALHHGPEVNNDKTHEPGIEENVESEDRFEVVIRHRHNQTIRSTQIQHQNRQVHRAAMRSPTCPTRRQRFEFGFPNTDAIEATFNAPEAATTRKTAKRVANPRQSGCSCRSRCVRNAPCTRRGQTNQCHQGQTEPSSM
jgi:hypothetical protein